MRKRGGADENKIETEADERKSDDGAIHRKPKASGKKTVSVSKQILIKLLNIISSFSFL
jgi:hypothetical protein